MEKPREVCQKVEKDYQSHLLHSWCATLSIIYFFLRKSFIKIFHLYLHIASFDLPSIFQWIELNFDVFIAVRHKYSRKRCQKPFSTLVSFLANFLFTLNGRKIITVENKNPLESKIELLQEMFYDG